MKSGARQVCVCVCVFFTIKRPTALSCTTKNTHSGDTSDRTSKRPLPLCLPRASLAHRSSSRAASSSVPLFFSVSHSLDILSISSSGFHLPANFVLDLVPLVHFRSLSLRECSSSLKGLIKLLVLSSTVLSTPIFSWLPPDSQLLKGLSLDCFPYSFQLNLHPAVLHLIFWSISLILPGWRMDVCSSRIQLSFLSCGVLSRTTIPASKFKNFLQRVSIICKASTVCDFKGRPLNEAHQRTAGSTLSSVSKDMEWCLWH